MDVKQKWLQPLYFFACFFAGLITIMENGVDYVNS